MKSILKQCLIILLYICFVSNTGFTQENRSKEIINKIIESYGKRQDILSVTAYRLEADITARARKKTGTVIRVSEGLFRLKVLIDYTTDMEIRIFKDNEVFRGPSFQKLVPVQGPMKTSVILQAARADLPWVLIKNQDKVTLEKEDKNFFILNISPGEGMFLRCFVDTKTYLIKQTESLIKMGQNVLIFKNEYSDFRMIGGVLFPFQEENYASGIHTATTKIKKVQFNPSKELLELLPEH